MHPAPSARRPGTRREGDIVPEECPRVLPFQMDQRSRSTLSRLLERRHSSAGGCCKRCRTPQVCRSAPSACFPPGTVQDRTSCPGRGRKHYETRDLCLETRQLFPQVLPATPAQSVYSAAAFGNAGWALCDFEQLNYRAEKAIRPLQNYLAMPFLAFARSGQHL